MTKGEDRKYISLQECLQDLDSSKYKVPLCLGKNGKGEFIYKDFVDMGHLLISGSTGTGKSVFINSFINTILQTKDCNDIKFIMIDPKMIELPFYNGIAYLQFPVITDMEKASEALRWCVEEIGRRKKKEYEEPYIVVLVDEFADLMLSKLGIDSLIEKIAKEGSKVGIYMLLSTSSPKDTVITETLRKLIPFRLAGALSSVDDSKRIIEESGAEELLGKGDMIFKNMLSEKKERVQVPYISFDDQKIIFKDVSKARGYSEIKLESQVEETDPLIDDAKRLVKEYGFVSAPLLQRKLKIGWNRAARLFRRLKDEEK